MELNRKSLSKDKNPALIPKTLVIPPSKEKGFNIENCMDDFKTPDTYEKDSDYYYDSYAHFGIHEEMLKDKVQHFHSQ